MDQLTGVWKLVSFNLKSTTTNDSVPAISHPLGRLIFTAEGYMNASVTDADAAKPLPDNKLFSHRGVDELASIVRLFTSYSGRFKVYEEGGQRMLSTDVDIALDPGMINKPQVRKVSIEKREVGHCSY